MDRITGRISNSISGFLRPDIWLAILYPTGQQIQYPAYWIIKAGYFIRYPEPYRKLNSASGLGIGYLRPDILSAIRYPTGHQIQHPAYGIFKAGFRSAITLPEIKFSIRPDI